MKFSNHRKISCIIFSIFTVICISLLISITACKQKAPEIETFAVQRGDITESISASGSVDSAEIKNYGVRESAEILEILKKANTFKKGDLLIKIDNSRANLLLSQSDQNLILAQQAIDIAKINYQAALDANHVAIQLAQSSSDLAEQSTINAYKAIENANILGEASINAAYTAIENANRLAEASINAAYNSLKDANEYLALIKASPLQTDILIAQAEVSAGTAENAYEQAKKNAESQINAAEGAYEQAKESSRSQSDAAEGAYEQALINQSITYWNNINSTLAAQTQINIMKKSIEQAKTQLEISRINYELTKLGIDDYQINAPFDGIVLNANFSKGETANPGLTAITVISSEFVIKSDINETDIAKLITGQEVQLTLDAYPEMSFKGTVSEISPVSKKIAEIVTFEITIKPEDNMKEYLKYGLSANLTVIISKVENVLYAPIQAVYDENNKSYVDVLTQDDEIKKIEVTTGMYNYDFIEIKTGLSEGDMIVTSRLEDLF